MTIDWAQLRATATEVAGRAYAPYSRLRVGAAGLAGGGLLCPAWSTREPGVPPGMIENLLPSRV